MLSTTVLQPLPEMVKELTEFPFRTVFVGYPKRPGHEPELAEVLLQLGVVDAVL